MYALTRLARGHCYNPEKGIRYRMSDGLKPDQGLNSRGSRLRNRIDCRSQFGPKILGCCLIGEVSKTRNPANANARNGRRRLAPPARNECPGEFNMSRRTFLALVGMLIAMSLGAGRLRAEDPRHVTLEGQPNCRDIGGYKTADGKTVKLGQVYRSGELPRLTDDDVTKLEALEIKSVVNFLTPAELEAHGRDRLPEGVTEIALPIKVGDNLAALGLKARQTGDFSAMPPELNSEVHEVLATEAVAEYGALLREVAKPEARPLIFHCSHGVHRTGTATAILLWALGVPWETVRQDYLLSNQYRKAEVEVRLGQLRELAAKHLKIAPKDVDMTNIRAFYILEGSYIDGARDAILKQYGTIDDYLAKGLGLTEHDIQRLRDQLLE